MNTTSKVALRATRAVIPLLVIEARKESKKQPIAPMLQSSVITDIASKKEEKAPPPYLIPTKTSSNAQTLYKAAKSRGKV